MCAKKLSVRLMVLTSSSIFVLVLVLGILSYNTGRLFAITKNAIEEQHFKQEETGFSMARGRVLISRSKRDYPLKTAQDLAFFSERYPLGTSQKWVAMRPDQLLDLGWEQNFWRRAGFLRQTFQRRGDSRSYVAAPFWLFSLPFAVLPSWTLYRFIRRARRSRRGLCRQCGYDLRASPDKCPECGMSVPVGSVDSAPSARPNSP